MVWNRQKLEFSFRHVKPEMSVKHTRRDMEYADVKYTKIDSKRQVKTDINLGAVSMFGI